MKGFIEINMNGSPVGLRFAYPAHKRFAEALEKKPDLYFIDDEDNKVKMTIEGLAKFIQCGYLNQCDVREVEPTLTYEDFFNYADEAEESEEIKEEIGRVIECWSQTRYAKKMAEVEEKKSAIGTI